VCCWGKERCSGGGLVYANYYFGQQPKLTDALYKGNTNRHRRTVSPRRTPKGAFWVLAAILSMPADTQGYSRTMHSQLSQERVAAPPRALMSCTTDVKRRAKSPWLRLLHCSRGAIYNALCLD
jgi:hypothetical protein